MFIIEYYYIIIINIISYRNRPTIRNFIPRPTNVAQRVKYMDVFYLNERSVPSGYLSTFLTQYEDKRSIVTQINV